MLSIAHFAKTDMATRTTIFQAQERGHPVFVVVPKLPVCVVPGTSFSIRRTAQEQAHRNRWTVLTLRLSAAYEPSS